MVKIGLIGGSGLEKLNLFGSPSEILPETPFGTPSSTLFTGILDQCEIFILSRHGRDHTISPTHINNRANIACLREVGCKYIIGTTACGSLKEEIHMGDLVIPDQFIDFTRHRVCTFYDKLGPGNVGHVSMPDPFNGYLRNLLIKGATELGFSFHRKGTAVTIEGPRFSTRAESLMFRSLGADVINMTLAPEVALSCEAGVPYASIALSTDYDSWRNDHETVTWDNVVRVFEENVRRVTQLLCWIFKNIE